MSDEGSLTFDEIMEFGGERVEDEIEEFDGDVPDHTPQMLVSRATDLLQTLANFKMSRAHNEVPDPGDGEMKTAIEDDIVDVLMAISAVKDEHDLDIVSAFEEHMEFVRSYNSMQEDLQNAESSEDELEAVEEHMGDIENAPVEMPIDGMGDGIEPGDNVDADEYDADENRDRHIQ